jgi:hypothetical protein
VEALFELIPNISAESKNNLNIIAASIYRLLYPKPKA